MAGMHTLIIKLNEGAGLGEKPKVFLDNKEVGRVTAFKTLSVEVTAGQHSLYLKGKAGGGRVARISINEMGSFTECYFDLNIMSLRERYYLARTYSDGENTVPAKTEDNVTVQPPQNSAEPPVTHPVRKPGNKFAALVLVIIIAVVGGSLLSNLIGAGKMDGVYYANLQYLIFTKDGIVKEGTPSKNGVLVYGIGTYKMEGEKIIVQMDDLRPESAVDVYTYDKATDTLKTQNGSEYIRVE